MNRNEVIKSRILKVVDMLIKLILIGIIVLIVSCEQRLEEAYENFTIPKHHHAGNLPKIQSLQSRSLSFETIFDHSAIYETKTAENQYDINKLLGFADCNAHHHDNSARFGWRWLDGKLEIHAYVYNDKVRSSQYIGEVDLNKSYHYNLSINNDYYIFNLEGNDPVYMKRTGACNRGFYYMLFPYFGGNETAPHDILIKVRFNY